MTKYILALITALLLNFSAAFATNKTIYSKIQPYNLSSLEWQDEDWPNESFYNYLMRCLDYQLNMQDFKKRRVVFKLFDKLATKEPAYPSALYDMTTAEDLNFFCGKKSGDTYIAEIIDNTDTELGKVFLYGLIGNPLSNITVLQQRQTLIKELVNDQEFYKQLKAQYTAIAQAENIVLSFWWGQDCFLNTANRHYFTLKGAQTLNEWLNKSPIALEVNTLLGHKQRALFLATSAFAATILPIYGIYQLRNKELPKPFNKIAEKLQGSGGSILALIASSNNKAIASAATIGAGIYCGISCKEEYEWARDNFVIDFCLQKKMNLIAQFFTAVQDLSTLIENHPRFSNLCSAAATIKEFMHTIETNEELQQLMQLLSTNTFKGNPSVFCYHGRVLVAYRLMHELKEQFELLLKAISEIDAYLSCATLYKKFENKRARFCFVEFKDTDEPFIYLKESWNPFINPDKVVTNTICLGGQHKRNMIITGPNAGGKSTLIKMVPTALDLSQSLTLCPAEEAIITPFDSIATYLNIVDDIGAGNSLFKAQVLRAQEMVSLAEQTTIKKFIALDEMFNGASPKESKSAAYSVAKHIGQFENTVCMIATHFPLLTKLEEKYSSFANYKVSVEVDPVKGIRYPFKLEPGISQQHIALDILRNEGFASSIVEEAQALLSAPAA